MSSERLRVRGARAILIVTEAPASGACVDRRSNTAIDRGQPFRAMTERSRVPTGNPILDTALGGGLPAGALLLLDGEEGAGATEFALSILRGVARGQMGRKARFSTVLRPAASVAREAAALFEDEKLGATIEVQVMDPANAPEGCRVALKGLAGGDVLVLESAAALYRALPERAFTSILQGLRDAVAEAGATVLVLHASGSIPATVEAEMAEVADGVFSFRWRDGGTSRRRLLAVTKLRGLAPILDGDEVPVYEAGLHRGLGFSLSQVKSVV